MEQETLLKNILAEVMELKAMISQLGAVSVPPTIEEEIAAVQAQGLDIVDYFKQQGRAAVKADKLREVNHEGSVKDAGKMAGRNCGNHRSPAKKKGLRIISAGHLMARKADIGNKKAV